MTRLEDSPLAFFKVGVLCAEPEGFIDELTVDYDAHLISAEQIRADLMDEHPEVRGHSLGKRITRKVFQETAEILQKGDNAVIDKYFMTPNSRGAITNHIHNLGGLAIALVTKIPSNVSKQRVKDLAETDGFIVPTDDWDLEPLACLQTMRNQWNNPDNHVHPQREPMDIVIRLDGVNEIDDLLDKVDSELERNGI